MSSFREKINTKLNISKKQEEQFLPFDDNSIRITVVGGQTQLCPIKLNCAWQLPAMGPRVPELTCNWFNKTLHSMTQIKTINGSYYQPCFEDVGQIIHIQCIPEFNGREYEGMPIIKEVGPIKLDPETEEEANDLLNCGKASFLVKIANGNAPPQQGLIKISGGEMKIQSKLGEEKEICQYSIKGKGNIYECVRSSAKKIKITLNQEEIGVEFSNNKIRDVFLLLTHLIAQHEQGQEGKEEVKEEVKEEAKQEWKEELKEEGGKRMVSEITTVPVKSEKSEDNCREEEEIKRSEEHLQKGKKGSAKTSNSGDGRMEQVRSEGDFTATHSNQNGGKKTSESLIEMEELREKLKSMSQEVDSLKAEVQILKERETNFNHNYLLLEEEGKKNREQLMKVREEMSYYQNECRIVKTDKQNLDRKSWQLNKELMNLKQKLSHFQENEDQCKVSYSELEKDLEDERRAKREMQNLLHCERRELQKAYDSSLELQHELERLEGEKDFFKRKYENLHAEITKNPTLDDNISDLSSPTLSISRVESSMSEQIEGLTPEKQTRMQKEILSLKKQMKELIDENNFLRSINIGSKDKSKSSSKTVLKMELMELKKIVNKLTENLTEKDLALEQMKKVNKELVAKIVELSK